MSKQLLFIYAVLAFVLSSCNSASEELKTPETELESASNNNLLTDYAPLHDDGDINAVIEIPAGTIQKWELNKSSGKVEWEKKDGKPRVINYIGYPGNYGMIPRTLLSKDKGGDGDPLDILVLGPPAEQSAILKCKLLGVLYLQDRGEQDDKLIAVSIDSPLYEVNSIKELDENYNGISEIIELWFANYKGPGKMESKGFGNKKEAEKILTNSIEEYLNTKSK